MSKKIAIALAALMLLIVALPASAAIKATSVEVRGTVAADPISAGQLNLSVGDVSWNPNNFAGFYYDLKDDLGTENLTIVTGALGGSDRTIETDKLIYNTTGQGKSLKAVENGKATETALNGLEKFASGEMGPAFGKYKIVGWQAGSYVGIKNRTYKLAKLILEQGNATAEKKTLTIGETWDIGGGWTMTANSIDAKASPRQVWVTLNKDGVKKDDKVVQQGAVYTFVEKSIGGESDVPLFVTYVDSIFAGATTDMAQFRYTWVVDTSVTEIKGGDKFGVFKVGTVGDQLVQLKNTDNTVTVSRDTTVDLMGEMKFKVADNANVRFYPMATRTTPGTYEVRGTVAAFPPSAGQLNLSDGLVGQGDVSWNPNNFAGFYYDLKDDLGTENLNIVNGSLGGTSDRTIETDKLIYNTTGQGKSLKAVENGKANETTLNGLEKFASGEMGPAFGKYKIVGWQAQPYVGIKNRTYKLAKLILEQGNATAEKKTLTVGETWDIGGGWTMTANSIDAKAAPRQVWVTLNKDGVKKDDKVVQQGAIYTFVEKSIGGESDVPLFVTYVDSIFAGATTDMAQFRYTWVVDTSVTEIKGGDKFGVFKVGTVGDQLVSLKNTDSTVTVSRDTTVDLMGEMKFKVADNANVRFYPKVDYEIAGVVPGVTPTPGVTPGVTPKVNVTVKPTNVTVTPTTPAETTPAKATPVATTPREPGFEAVFAIAGLLAVAYIVLRQRK